ncbi:IPT/TIG domain-containing protein [Myxococcota bacterium]|nr:IPT/TIG domain-containing protein [Myxococcota bacterium]
MSPPTALLLRALPLLLASAGCYPRLSITVPAADDSGSSADGGGTDAGTSDGGGDGGGTGVLRLDDLLPTDGPTSGDTVVELVGGPFDASVVVRFGDQDAPIDSQTADRLVVRSPPAVDAGPVDVSVQVTGASTSLPDAWTYWQDAEGQAVLTGTWLQLEIGNPTTWTGVAPTFDAWVRFTQPTDSEPWQRYGIPFDSCGDPVDTFSSLQGPEEILFGYSTTLLALTWSDTRQEYAYQALAAPDPMPDQPLLLQAARSDLSPPLALGEVARTPAAPRVTGPDLAADTIPELKYSAPTVTWIPSGQHHVVIAVGDGGTTAFLCIVEDDGDFTIPSALFDELDWVSQTGTEDFAAAWMALAGVSSGVTPLTWTDGEARFDAGLGTIGRIRVVGGPEVAP